MKLAALTPFLVSLFFTPSARGENLRVSFDDLYDNPNGDLSTVACSDGPNGMLTKGFTTFESLRKAKLHYVGATSAVEGWNSQKCGSCWELSYDAGKQGIQSVVVIAVDHTKDGFNIGRDALDKLTNGAASDLGHAVVDAKEVDC
ncbi:hypothetical protein V5O48_006318 [Marasmius crinis-equi]|uniref:Cerato-platanin n=1 Tax=Marasmius crinis-equi TaxID=585013 RepID=A0ABR3FKG5_9AGAR